jgi:aspartate/glutamate racemase
LRRTVSQLPSAVWRAGHIYQAILDVPVLGRIDAGSRRACRKIVARLVQAAGAEGIILGCAEPPPLHGAGNGPVPLAETTECIRLLNRQRTLPPRLRPAILAEPPSFFRK